MPPKLNVKNDSTPLKPAKRAKRVGGFQNKASKSRNNLTSGQAASDVVLRAKKVTKEELAKKINTMMDRVNTLETEKQLLSAELKKFKRSASDTAAEFFDKVKESQAAKNQLSTQVESAKLNVGRLAQKAIQLTDKQQALELDINKIKEVLMSIIPRLEAMEQTMSSQPVQFYGPVAPLSQAIIANQLYLQSRFLSQPAQAAQIPQFAAGPQSQFPCLVGTGGPAFFSPVTSSSVQATDANNASSNPIPKSSFSNRNQ